MAKDHIRDYDLTAGNNTDVDGVSIAEGTAPSNINDAIREIMAHQAELHADTRGGLSSTGTPNAYALTTNETISAYAAGCTFTFVANFTNTGSATLNIDAVGALTIKKEHNVNLEAGDIEQYQVCVVAYQSDDNTFQLLTPTSTNKRYFSAYLGSTQSIPFASVTIVSLDSEGVDSASEFNTGTFRYTPTVPGYYFVEGNVTYANNQLGKAVRCDIYKNSALALSGITLGGRTATQEITDIDAKCSGLVYMNGTDFLTLRTYHDMTGSQNIVSGSAYTHLSGFKVS